MKKLAIVFIGLFLMAFSFNAQAQNATSNSATTTANVITPIAVVKSGDLSFGNIIGTPAGGTVTIATNGTKTASAPALLPGATMTGTVTAASFDVSGAPNATYSIVLPASSFDVTETGGATMSVGTFVSDPATTGTLSAGGTQTVNVGATITVGTNQTVGVYTNTTDLTITVAYN